MIGDGRLSGDVAAVVVGGTALIGGEHGCEPARRPARRDGARQGHCAARVLPNVQQTVKWLMIIAAVALSLNWIRHTIVRYGPVMLAARAPSRSHVDLKVSKNVNIEVRRNEVVGLFSEKGRASRT